MKNETDQLIKKMGWIVAFAIVAIIVVYGFYFFKFFSGFKFSDQTGVWGTFGDYVGGILNPILSFFSLIAISLTLTLQIKELKNSKDESKRTDVHRLIEKLAERINKNYKEEKIELNNGSQAYLISLSTALLSKNKNNLERIFQEYENTSSSTFNTIFAIENDLERLCVYIKMYESLNQHNDSIMRHFYKAEFEDLISTLVCKGWIANTSTQEILYEFLGTN